MSNDACRERNCTGENNNLDNTWSKKYVGSIFCNSLEQEALNHTAIKVFMTLVIRLVSNLIVIIINWMEHSEPMDNYYVIRARTSL